MVVGSMGAVFGLGWFGDASGVIAEGQGTE
jgi:hypothetical protein